MGLVVVGVVKLRMDKMLTQKRLPVGLIRGGQVLLIVSPQFVQSEHLTEIIFREQAPEKQVDS